jgi:isocitrate/isopropylmalate dehydrogenase
MSVNESFHIAVLVGDGIGPEVMAPALDVLRAAAALTPGLGFSFSEAPAGAGHYRDTGTSLPDTTVKLCEQADAILLGACGLPHIRYPDNTEIMPQVELRFISTPMPACVRAASFRHPEPLSARLSAASISLSSGNRPKACLLPWARACHREQPARHW